jgi:hypothetical protein
MKMITRMALAIFATVRLDASAGFVTFQFVESAGTKNDHLEDSHPAATS